MRWTTEEISEGVGRIWKVSSGKWCFETVYGHKGGPMNKACAQSRMECHWATQTRERAGLAQKMDRRESPKQKELWAWQGEMIRKVWRV